MARDLMRKIVPRTDICFVKKGDQQVPQCFIRFAEGAH